MEAGGLLAFGSDAPIEDPDPLKGIHAAVTRRDPAKPDSPSWNASECLKVSEAIDAYTTGAARAAGMQDITGRVEEGLQADFTILDKNILVSPDPDLILEAQIEATVIRGEIHSR
jgi:predicted amidohydrolase YtcJ